MVEVEVEVAFQLKVADAEGFDGEIEVVNASSVDRVNHKRRTSENFYTLVGKEE